MLFFVAGRILDEHHFDAGSFQQIDSVGESVFLAIDHSYDASLDDEFCAFDAWRRCHIQCGTFAAVAERATLVMALASACSTYGFESPFSSSQTFSNPIGVPL